MENYTKMLKSLIKLSAYGFVLIFIFDTILSTLVRMTKLGSGSGVWVVAVVLAVVYKDKIIKFVKSLEGGVQNEKK